MRRRHRFFSLLFATLCAPLAARAGDNPFPFGVELMLDVEPLYGSKRIPMIEIENDGATTIDHHRRRTAAAGAMHAGAADRRPGPVDRAVASIKLAS